MTTFSPLLDKLHVHNYKKVTKKYKWIRRLKAKSMAMLRNVCVDTLKIKYARAMKFLQSEP